MSALNDPRRHDDLLNFQLKHLLTIGGAPAIRLCEGKFGVTRAEWRLVAALVESGAMNPTALAALTHMEPGRVSLVLTRLLAKGFVERMEEVTDRRRASMRATAAGERLYAELFPQLAEINRRIVSVLSESETQQLEECLRRLTERAQQIYDEGGGVDARANRRLGGSQRAWR
jgi:DNA-binding MarR family transcriptional regulator